MIVRYHQVDLTTDAGQAATGYTPPINGELIEVQYVKGDFVDGVDVEMTGATTGRAIWAELNVNSSTVKSPRQATHSIIGAALVYAGAAPVADRIRLAGEAIKIAITSGGAAKAGSFRFVTREG